MNLLYLKYAVEVASCGSINKAAEKLYIGQPNLSRAVKELEASLGVSLFERSAKGMEPTPDGEVFLEYAKSILKQVDAVEGIFKRGGVNKKRFSISVPRASYIGEAFANFSRAIGGESDAEVLYMETNASRAVQNILREDYKLGIVRYAENFDRYYKSMFEEKGLVYELVAEFRYVLVTNREGWLASKDEITPDDLKDGIEIAHADPFVPSLPVSEVKKEELSDDVRRRIYVFERASQFELLAANPETFMWVSPVPQRMLDRYGLCERECGWNRKIYKDVMIYREDYRLTALDKIFISELCNSKRETIK